MDVLVWISIALLSCLLAGYFGTCHLALKNFSRARLLELLHDRGRDDRLDPFLQRVGSLQLMSGTIRTCLNLFVLLVMLLYFELRNDAQTATVTRYVLALTISGLFVCVFSVAIPLSWARYHSEELLARSMGLLMTLLLIFRPVTATLYLLDPIVRRIIGADLISDPNLLSDEVLSVVEERDQAGDVDQDQRHMIEAVFEFGSTTVGGIMTPRTDVKGVEVETRLEDLKKLILSDGHSRYPVYDESLDSVIGVLYVKDLLRFVGKDGQPDFSMRQVIREALMVPETKRVRELLAEFKSKKVHIAIVLDEYGGTAGLVTVEDIIEEIVGDIQDEYELTQREPTIRRIDEKTLEVDGRVYVDDLNDALHIHVPEDEDYETVGGFVFSTLGHIPEVGEAFEFANFRMTVTGAERTKVKQVRVEIVMSSSDDSNER